MKMSRSVHRPANPGKIPLELIEVQVGSYLGEDDIVRLDDIYQRHRELTASRDCGLSRSHEGIWASAQTIGGWILATGLD
jgi:Mannose-6-phosphate isomerase